MCIVDMLLELLHCSTGLVAPINGCTNPVSGIQQTGERCKYTVMGILLRRSVSNQMFPSGLVRVQT